jgi:two-component system, NarL family, sensor kinase
MIERPAERPSSVEHAGRRGEPADPAGEPLHEIVGRVREITRANEHLFARLIEGERRFRGLAKAVWKVQEDERRRLARELHDGLGQTLTALTHQLERLREKAEAGAGDNADIAARLADSVEMARLALNETRELSRLLRPPVLDDLGLAAALSWLARTLEQRTGLKVELALDIEAEVEPGVESEIGPEIEPEIETATEGGLPDGSPASGRLDPDLETLVFRLVQEALTNVLRHAAVDRAQVAVRRAGGALELRVADAGRGFEPAAVFLGGAMGSGLRGMRDRLELFGGRLEIASAPGRGTVVSATVPLVSPAGADT